MRRISLSVLAGVALLSATVLLLHGAGASVSQPVIRVSAQLVPVAPSGLAPAAAPGLAAGKSGLRQRLARFRANLLRFALPPAPRPTVIPAHPRIRPPLSLGMACPAATGSSPGGCSIVPCALYVGAGQASYTVTSGLGLAILPRATTAPAPGGRTPAGTCVSRPGRPPQLRWVSSAGG